VLPAVPDPERFPYTTALRVWLDDQARTFAEATGATVVPHLVAGEPADALVDVATQEAADLMIVGSHGRRGLQRLMLGSVAEHVVRNAPCPVLVARERRPSATRDSNVPIVTAALASAVTGGVVGAIAGPPGVVVGSAIGATVGAAAAATVREDERMHAERDEELDEDIGVIGGAIGAASPDAPPARIGAFSAAAAGAGGGEPDRLSEGPISAPDD
jgi:hypothetical protein